MPLARADADEPFFRELLQDLQLGSMPQVVAYRKLFAMPYVNGRRARGLWEEAEGGGGVPSFPHAALSFLGVDSDQARQALYDETGIREEVTEEDTLPSSAARVLGIFSDIDIEEEESAEFMLAARERRSRHDVYFARVDDPQISQALIDAGFADRTPAVIVANDGILFPR